MICIELLKAKQTGGGVWLSGIKYEGECLVFWDNGNIRSHSNWKNGKLHGEYKRWDYNENLNVHEFYKNGKLIERIK